MGIPMLRYYASGSHQDGSTSFGIPVATLAEGTRICQERHSKGYRKLRVYDREKDSVYRYHVRYGLIGPHWEQA